MKGDFSRWQGDPSRHTFDKLKHYAGVLHQQGRVWLDSDWNTELLLHLNMLREETFDIIGKCGAPKPGTAFAISPPLAGNPPDAFEIAGGSGPRGRYYVDGILCQLDRNVNYLTQPDFPSPPRITMPATGSLLALVYIEVWQRLITYLEDEDIREVALGAPDTATRVKTIAQVKIAPLTPGRGRITCDEALASLPVNGGTLSTLQPTDTLPPDPCRIPDPSTYTGRENHLYRVEIHDGGDVLGATGGSTFSIRLQANAAVGSVSLNLVTPLSAAQANALRRSGAVTITDDNGQIERLPLNSISTDNRTITLARGLRNAYATNRNATVTGGVARFKWSRDNASFAVKVTAIGADRKTLTLASLGRDQVTALREGDLIEISDDVSELGPARGHLTNLTADPNPDTFEVTIADSLPLDFAAPGSAISGQTVSPPAPTTDGHMILRRWDGQGSAQSGFNETTTPQLNLGDGVHIQFGGSNLRSGDYWQFAARSIDGSIEILRNAPPMGITRHRCALALVRWENQISFNRQLAIRVILQSALPVAVRDEIVRQLQLSQEATVSEGTIRSIAQQAGANAAQIEELIRLLVASIGRGAARDPVMTVVEDCREPFRPLTELDCECECTVAVRPGESLAAAIAQVPAGGGTVCLLPGLHVLDGTLSVNSKHGLTIRGAGVSTIIHSPTAAFAMFFKDCDNLTIKDLMVVGGKFTEAQTTSPPAGTGPIIGPGTVGPIGPGTVNPGGPGTVGPVGPGTVGPVGPGTVGPVGPGTVGPVGPGTVGPVGPGNVGPVGPVGPGGGVVGPGVITGGFAGPAIVGDTAVVGGIPTIPRPVIHATIGTAAIAAATVPIRNTLAVSAAAEVFGVGVVQFVGCDVVRMDNCTVVSGQFPRSGLFLRSCVSFIGSFATTPGTTSPPTTQPGGPTTPAPPTNIRVRDAVKLSASELSREVGNVLSAQAKFLNRFARPTSAITGAVTTAPITAARGTFSSNFSLTNCYLFADTRSFQIGAFVDTTIGVNVSDNWLLPLESLDSFGHDPVESSPRTSAPSSFGLFVDDSQIVTLERNFIVRYASGIAVNEMVSSPQFRDIRIADNLVVADGSLAMLVVANEVSLQDNMVVGLPNSSQTPNDPPTSVPVMLLRADSAIITGNFIRSTTREPSTSVLVHADRNIIYNSNNSFCERFPTQANVSLDAKPGGNIIAVGNLFREPPTIILITQPTTNEVLARIERDQQELLTRFMEARIPTAEFEIRFNELEARRRPLLAAIPAAQAGRVSLLASANAITASSNILSYALVATAPRVVDQGNLTGVP